MYGSVRVSFRLLSHFIMVLYMRCGLVLLFELLLFLDPNLGSILTLSVTLGFHFVSVGVCSKHRITLAVVRRLEQVLTLVPASIMSCFYYYYLPSWLLWSPAMQLVLDVTVAKFRLGLLR